MEIQNLPSLRSLFSRMQELEKITENPSSVISFPELLEKEWKGKQTGLEENPGVLPKENPPSSLEGIHLPFPREDHISWDQKHQKSPQNGNTDLMSFLEKTAMERGVDPNLVKAVVKAESNFKTNAVSPKGAMGLMQLMPKTADMLGVDDPMNPYDNLSGGINYLGDMLERFGKTEEAIAAYNAGPGAVKKHKGVPPYSETQDYVSKVKKYYRKFSNSV
ncbi:lytic transglycosylase domain-containing protein [Leptospira ilyithenensis]|uniref:Lytic transglycosylase domain-containing protein n=1 Tax=Leptospira ilyithenensis TaxID=2484901 RepID=A0A4V3JXH4_9LEPT|nr:lytic transglycosylase domain-containing protein [Leptospira ilyithenensis]TGN14529.1 lytic transglycosylase domain-containing protein [Leptospira ilyithenensis]